MTIIGKKGLEFLDLGDSVVCDEKKGANGVELLNVNELADFLEVGVRTVWRYDAENKIPEPITKGRLKRWSKQEIVLWLELDKPSRKAFKIIQQKG